MVFNPTPSFALCTANRLTSSWPSYTTGHPGRRSLSATLLADPRFTFHLKQSAQADLSARATPVRDSEQRREIFAQILGKLGHDDQLSAWVDGSPLVEVTLET